MSARLTIALDAMGGDKAPEVVVEGLSSAHLRHPQVHFLLFGDRARLEPLLEKAAARKACEIVHTDQVVKGDDKPSQVLRQGRQSSMWLAVDAVAKGRASGVVSAGNTGALMAIS